MNVLIMVVRIFVLLAALGGAVGSVAGGFFMRWGAIETKRRVERRLAEETTPGDEFVDLVNPISTEQLQQDQVQRTRAYPFLLAGGVLALVGGILAMTGRTGSAAVWLLVAAAGPTILNWGSVCSNFAVFLAAVLSLLAWGLTFAVKEPEPAVA